MKRYITNIIKTALYISLFIVYIAHFQSCANTSGGPIGGPKDTIPPVIVATIPDSILTNFPLLKGKITLTFDEYVQLKNQYNEIVVSPPSNKRPKTRIKGKSIILSFQDTLKEDQTYSVYFGNSISDVNESNPFSNYVYTFSTGNSVDSLIISGTVMSYDNLFPVKNALIMLYENPKDSSVIKELPTAIAKSDEWGYFCIRGLKSVPYSIYAIEDKNNNFLYDKGGEIAGFADSTFIPTVVAKGDIPQIMQYDMKDTLKCLARPSEIDIYMFKEVSDNQYLSNYGRVSERECFLKFNTKGVQIDTFIIKGIFSDKIIKQYNEGGDSLTFWINDQRKIEDTLTLRLCYMKTDTTGSLVPSSETLKFAVPFDKSKIKKESNTLKARSYAESLAATDLRDSRRNTQDFMNNSGADESKKEQPKEREDLLKIKVEAKGENVENKGVEIIFPTPLIKIERDSIRFTSTNPRKVKSNVDFTLERDTTNILRYIIRAKESYKTGFDYEIYFPTATFTDINNYTNDSLLTKFSLPVNDKLSSITLEVRNVKGNRYIVELVNEKRDKVYFKYEISEDKDLIFPYLLSGNYSFRITEDKNKNGKLDVGSILERKQPEKARLLKLKDNKVVIILEEQTDLTQTVDLEQLFE